MAELLFSIKDDVSMESLLEDSNFDYQEVGKAYEAVEGKIVDIQPHKDESTSEIKEYAIISLSSKREGRIGLFEFKERPSVGDAIKGLVKGIDKNTGLINISQEAYKRKINWQMILDAFENNLAISCTIRKIFNNSYIVYIENIPMLLPIKESHALKNSRVQLKRKIGDVLLVKVVSIDEKKKRGIVSHKRFLIENKEAAWKNFVKKYREGDTAQGKIFKKVSYGIFVIIDEVLGLVNNEDITWGKVLTKKKVLLNLIMRFL